MANYRVTWIIDVEADNESDAAAQCLGIMQDPESIATVFTIQGPSGAVCIDAATGEEYPSDFPGYCTA